MNLPDSAKNVNYNDTASQGENNAVPNHLLFKIEILKIDEAAQMLGWSVGHLYNLVWKREIPYHKKRGSLYFLRNELLNWYLEGE